MFARIEVECKNPEQVIRAISVDESETEKFSTKLSAGKNKILLEVESKDISGLMAGMNSKLKLIKVAGEVSEIE